MDSKKSELLPLVLNISSAAAIVIAKVTTEDKSMIIVPNMPLLPYQGVDVFRILEMVYTSPIYYIYISDGGVFVNKKTHKKGLKNA